MKNYSVCYQVRNITANQSGKLEYEGKKLKSRIAPEGRFTAFSGKTEQLIDYVGKK